MPALRLQRIELQQNTDELRAQLRTELDECTDVQACYRNKIEKFMAAEGLWHIKDLDYPIRKRYAEFLTGKVKPVCYSTYLKAFDRIVRRAINRRLKAIAKGKILSPPYANAEFFLPYYPDPEIARQFENSTKKKDLVWDFSRTAPENMKRQIFTVLDYEIHHPINAGTLRNHLVALRKFYDFCTEESVEDIEHLELEDIRRFTNTLKPGDERSQGTAIVDCCRKALFMQAEKIRWEAPVWYLERFHIQSERLDPAAPVKHISFLEVVNKQNRRLLQQYFRYGLGITNLSLKSLRSEFHYIRKFLMKLDQPEGESVCTLKPEQMDAYLKGWQNKKIQPETYNKNLMAILHFFQFLFARRQIEKIPFQEDYYLKKEIHVHHNRSVEPQAVHEMLTKLHRFPEELRLMFLHLWGIGLRISEVCTLKGSAYYIQGQDAWIQVYQIKVRSFKRIPIPDALYQLMQVYMQKHHIQAGDYVFQNQNGGAYCSGTFRKKMLRYCDQNHIQNGEYLFKCHDYRHTLATRFYDAGVPLQTIRDYLGHVYEEMTQQYVDYMPRKIDKASAEYFGRHGSLAAGLLKKKGGTENR